MRRKSRAAAAIIGVLLVAGTHGWGAGRHQRDEDPTLQGCSAATLEGTYGIQIQGTRPAPAPAPPGSIESVIGVIIRHYDGRGQFTQVGNEKGSISGSAPPDRQAFGTYLVNEDCTGVHEVQIPGLPFPITDRFVIVDHGREVRNFVVDPGPLMVTGVSRRVR